MQSGDLGPKDLLCAAVAVALCVGVASLAVWGCEALAEQPLSVGDLVTVVPRADGTGAVLREIEISPADGKPSGTCSLGTGSFADDGSLLVLRKYPDGTYLVRWGGRATQTRRDACVSPAILRMSRRDLMLAADPGEAVPSGGPAL